MDTVSLISLVVDYEVSPLSIIGAIERKQLRPIVREGEPLSLDNVSFEAAQVCNVFWASECRYKSEADRVDLTRRLTRYDAIIASLIGAVTGSATTLISEAISREKDEPRDLHSPPAGAPSSLRLPVDPPLERFRLSRSAEEMVFRLNSGMAESLVLKASGNGEVSALFADAETYYLNRVWIEHGHGWRTSYTVKRGLIQPLVQNGQRVQAGQPLLRVEPMGPDFAAAFGIWHWDALPIPNNITLWLNLVEWSHRLESYPEEPWNWYWD